jgi:predicted thioredoxin/glutaredoxin
MESGHARRVITVYPITGKQLFFRVPHSWCEECNLSIRVVERVAADLDHVEVRIRPWFNNLVAALRRGGWHTPVVTIDGEIFSQGIVPDEYELRSALAAGSDDDAAEAPAASTEETATTTD